MCLSAKGGYNEIADYDYDYFYDSIGWCNSNPL